jgi:hypothetical protein
MPSETVYGLLDCTPDICPCDLAKLVGGWTCQQAHYPIEYFYQIYAQVLADQVFAVRYQRFPDYAVVPLVPTPTVDPNLLKTFGVRRFNPK